MGGMTAFMIVVCGTSLVCYVLMTRVQNRNARRRSLDGENFGTSSDIHDSGSEGWNILGWFGGDNSSSDSSGNSGDSGGSDSGGGDSGGGDGGGGD